MLSATNHGPIALADLNHTALSQAQNMYVPYGPAVRNTCDPVFVAYATPVPVMSTNFGAPSYFAANVAELRCTAVVCGIWRSRTASCFHGERDRAADAPDRRLRRNLLERSGKRVGTRECPRTLTDGSGTSARLWQVVVLSLRFPNPGVSVFST
jgi:hypothetical protein